MEVGSKIVKNCLGGKVERTWWWTVYQGEEIDRCQLKGHLLFGREVGVFIHPRTFY